MKNIDDYKNLEKEEIEFLNAFSEKSAYPNPKFKKDLKGRFLKEYNNRGFLYGIFGITNTHFALMSLALFSLFIIGVGAVSYINPATSTQGVESLSEAQKKDILSSVINNNSIDLIKKNPTEDILLASRNNYNYRATTTLTTTNNTSKSCHLETINSSTQTFEYFSAENNYYKFIEKNNLGVVTKYHLINEDEIVKYEIGSKAKRTPTNAKLTPASFPISYLANQQKAQDALVEELAKRNTQVYKLVKILNKEYFILKEESPIVCDSIVSFPNSGTNKLVTLTWVDKNTYEIIKTEEFLNVESPETLIYTKEIKVEKKQIEFNDVKKTFILEYRFDFE